MRTMVVVGAAGVVAVAVGLVSYALGRSHAIPEPAAIALPAKVSEPDPLVTGTIPSPDPSTLPQLTSAPPIPAPPPVNSAEITKPSSTNVAATTNPICRKPNALGVTRVVEIDTSGGPGFGFEHFKQH